MSGYAVVDWREISEAFILLVIHIEVHLISCLNSIEISDIMAVGLFSVQLLSFYF